MTVSRTGAEAVFGLDVVFPCLTHVERGVPIADLPVTFRGDLVPAEGAEAKMPLGRETATAVWTSRGLRSHLKVAEVGPDKCVIQADQLPVDDTLRKAAEITQKLDPPYVSVPVNKGGYWPIVYQTERTASGRHVVVRLEGAEPGGFGHASRFSLLTATITAKPAP